MMAAVVREAGQAPVYGDFPEPVASAGESLVTVSAAALSHVTRSRASGGHYSASGSIPFIAGIDGVGRREDGRRVYFVLPKPPQGAMAERTVVPSAQCVLLPDALNDVTAAAIANPGMSSWAAFTERARLKAGETVLVNGATGAAGRLAVQIARHLGAKKVIATGRNAEALRAVADLGADVVIPIGDDSAAMEAGFTAAFGEGIDVVLDYLWGASMERLLVAAAKTGADAVPIRIVEIGSASGSTLSLPGAVLRASAIELMGSGIGSIPLDRFMEAIGGLLRATVPAGFRIATRPVALAEVGTAWAEAGDRRRIVFTL